MEIIESLSQLTQADVAQMLGERDMLILQLTRELRLLREKLQSINIDKGKRKK